MLDKAFNLSVQFSRLGTVMPISVLPRNEARLWLIKQYDLSLENPQLFTLLCVDNWAGIQGTYRANIGTDLRDKLPDSLINQFQQNVFYCSSNSSNVEDENQELQVIIQQLKQQKIRKIIVFIATNAIMYL